jgi:cell filamentation protein
MANKVSIRFYKDSKVRAVWDEEQNKWFFSLVDIVAAITDSPRPRVYWGTVKSRQKTQYGELYSKCIQLKLVSADGKRYATDCFAQEDITDVVKTLPAKNTTAFLDWFTFSDNSIDGQSRKKAYTFWESNT